MYYNMNKININKCKKYYIIENKKNKLKEYFYYDTLKSDLNNYYKVLYNKNKNIEELGIFIQIGSFDTFLKMKDHIFNLKNLNINVNVYFVIIKEEANKENINFLSSLIPRSTIIETINKGMDIGLFLINLLYLRNNNISHKYILKLHTKTDDRFRNNILDKLCTNNELTKCINLLKNNVDLGMINGTFVYNYNKNKSYFDNHIHYLNYLSKNIFIKELNYNNLEFPIGTFFYAKFEIFSLLDEINLKFIYNKLNDINTLDYNWYKIYYNLKNFTTEEIENHYKKNSNNYANNLTLQDKTNCSGMRDFMIEHALERFFGYMCRENNLSIIEL